MLKNKTTCAPQPGPGARALYLGGREHNRVSCTAEALVVTNARAQVMRFPLVRVARVEPGVMAVRAPTQRLSWVEPAVRVVKASQDM